jgi:hypothetical protein
MDHKRKRLLSGNRRPARPESSKGQLADTPLEKLENVARGISRLAAKSIASLTLGYGLALQPSSLGVLARSVKLGRLLDPAVVLGLASITFALLSEAPKAELTNASLGFEALPGVLGGDLSLNKPAAVVALKAFLAAWIVAGGLGQIVAFHRPASGAAVYIFTSYLLGYFTIGAVVLTALSAATTAGTLAGAIATLGIGSLAAAPLSALMWRRFLQTIELSARLHWVRFGLGVCAALASFTVGFLAFAIWTLAVHRFAVVSTDFGTVDRRTASPQFIRAEALGHECRRAPGAAIECDLLIRFDSDSPVALAVSSVSGKVHWPITLTSSGQVLDAVRTIDASDSKQLAFKMDGNSTGIAVVRPGDYSRAHIKLSEILCAAKKEAGGINGTRSVGLVLSGSILWPLSTPTNECHSSPRDASSPCGHHTIELGTWPIPGELVSATVQGCAPQ